MAGLSSHYFLLDNCKSGGFVLMCTADRTSSPWHNFVSDTDRWVVMNDPSHGLDFSWRSWSIF